MQLIDWLVDIEPWGILDLGMYPPVVPVHFLDLQRCVELNWIEFEPAATSTYWHGSLAPRTILIFMTWHLVCYHSYILRTDYRVCIHLLIDTAQVLLRTYQFDVPVHVHATRSTCILMRSFLSRPSWGLGWSWVSWSTTTLNMDSILVDFRLVSTPTVLVRVRVVVMYSPGSWNLSLEPWLVRLWLILPLVAAENFDEIWPLSSQCCPAPVALGSLILYSMSFDWLWSI